jgi:hypothetical protein
VIPGSWLTACKVDCPATILKGSDGVIVITEIPTLSLSLRTRDIDGLAFVQGIALSRTYPSASTSSRCIS